MKNDNASKAFLKEKIKNQDLYVKLEEKIKNLNESPAGVDHGSGYIRYYDYKANLTIAPMSASMITEFVLVNGGPDYIVPSGCYGAEVNGFGELGQMPQVHVQREKEDLSFNQWAIANANWYANFPISTPWGGASGSGTYYLWLGVGKDTYKVSSTLPY